MDILKNRAILSLKFSSLVTGAIMTVALAAFVACGGTKGTTNSTSNPTPTSAQTTVVQINMGDSPADWMLACSINISSMSLTGSNGNVTVVSSTVPMEMMHLMGTMQPLTMMKMPQGTYTGASITVGSATVMYMNPTTKALVQQTLSDPMSANVTFSSPINVGSTPMAMGFDLDLAKSVTADSSGNLSMNPVFHVTSGMQGSGNPMDFADGGIQQMMGVISGVSGSSFMMTSMQAAQTLTFSTNASTVSDCGMMSAMGNGTLVMVDAMLQPDGSLLATRLSCMMNANGMMGGGIITAVSGNPPTTLTIVMQNGAGSGMMSSYLADGATIDLSGSTTYEIDDDFVDMSGLPFTPVFDVNHLFAGQSVMPISSTGMMSGGMGGGMMGGGMMGGTITADELLLEPQGLHGTTATAITSGSTTSFDMTLPSDCAFTTLTRATKVTIYQQAKTIVAGPSPISNGASIHAFGLLFFDGGQWKMVASRIGAN